MNFFIIDDLVNFPGFKYREADSQLCHNTALNPNKSITKGGRSSGSNNCLNCYPKNKRKAGVKHPVEKVAWLHGALIGVYWQLGRELY